MALRQTGWFKGKGVGIQVEKNVTGVKRFADVWRASGANASSPASGEQPFKHDYHMFVPVRAEDSMEERDGKGEKKPVHSMDVITRAKMLSGNLDGKFREGTLGAAYRGFLYALVCLVLTLVTWLYVHVYVAAVFAYLVGYFWSEHLLNYGWSQEWWKGKACIATK